MGILQKYRNCVCGNDMRLEQMNNTKRFICRKKSCRKTSALFKNTFFSGSHLSAKEVRLRNTVNYEEMRFQMCRESAEISDRTICDWLSFCRDICTFHYQRHPKRLGGPGTIVEIDETCVSRRKYNRGRVLVRETKWMFGGIQRGTRNCFMEIVEDRSASTLLPLIQKYIAPGTTIMSDLWRGYFRINELPEGYQHLTVNHSINFIDPETGAHTQSIESNWQQFKMGGKKRYGTHRTMLQDYIEDFYWRREFGGNDCFYNFWNQVVEHYDQMEEENIEE
uniref:ISXO2-like transposase domain-containing protein n=1 Tax=Panagrolaimus davidi TaxID=227884 RepID=A0A914PX13_9BILA